jgi:hypothetical protein
MTATAVETLVLELAAADLWAAICNSVYDLMASLVGAAEHLWIKYAVPFEQLERTRANAAQALTDIFRKLGYVR